MAENYISEAQARILERAENIKRERAGELESDDGCGGEDEFMFIPLQEACQNGVPVDSCMRIKNTGTNMIKFNLDSSVFGECIGDKEIVKVTANKKCDNNSIDFVIHYRTKNVCQKNIPYPPNPVYGTRFVQKKCCN